MLAVEKKYIQEILALSHKMEAKLLVLDQASDLVFNQTLNQAFSDSDLSELHRLLKLLASSQSVEHQKLGGLSSMLHSTMTDRHFANFIVPFERYLDRGLRDDQFLITSQDKTEPAKHTRIPLEFALENIRSAFNVGSIFRSADCVGVRKVHLIGYTATPDSPQLQKTSMGTWDLVPHSVQNKLESLIPEWKNAGLLVVALETAEKAIPIYNLDLARPSIFIVGNERFGLDRKILDMVDHVAALPSFGYKNSLNVSVALSVAAFEWRRQWDVKQKS